MRDTYCKKCGTELKDDAAFCNKCGTATGPTTAETRTGFESLTSDKTVQNHWAKRVIAYIIDSVIVAVVIFALVLAAVLPGVILGGAGFPGWSGIWFGGLVPLVILAYFVIAEGAYSKTIGKHVMGLRVKRRDGRPMDMGTSFIRNISKIHVILLILDIAAGLGMRGEMSQKFSDRYVCTEVETVSPVTIIS